MPEAVAGHGMKWAHLSIRDVRVPDEKFETSRAISGLELRNCLRRGGSILIHSVAGGAAPA
jgi:hypothetical protein